MRAWLLLLILAWSAVAHAGRPCEDQPLTREQVERGMNLAQLTAKQLDASSADVLILARAGQDLSEYGLRWSHLAFVYRDQDENGKPLWRVLHKLNNCGSDHAGLYRQGLGEFFLDRPFRYEAAFVVLKPDLQETLLPLLRDNARVAAMNERRYSLVSYAWGTRYQQSNQWVLETLAGAADPAIHDRAAAQAWLKSHGYVPTDLHLSTMTRLGARLTQANVAFDDHPTARRFAGHIETITVDSMFAWLPRAGLSQDVVLIHP